MQAIDLASQISPPDVKTKELLAICHNNLSAAFEQLVSTSRSFQDATTLDSRDLTDPFQGDTEKTMMHCEQAITFNPKYTKALIRRGRSFLRNNKYEDALRGNAIESMRL